MARRKARSALQEPLQKLPDRGAHALAVENAAEHVFDRLRHLHGLTKTWLEPVRAAALLRGLQITAPGAGVTTPDRQACDELLAHAADAIGRRAALDACEFLGDLQGAPQGAALSWSDTVMGGASEGAAPSVDVSAQRRIAAIVALAEVLAGSEDESPGFALHDDGARILIEMDASPDALDRAGLALRRAVLWNAVALRPIRGATVGEGEDAGARKCSDLSTGLRVARYVRLQVEVLLSRTWGLGMPDDLEFVHEMRVALRRARAALQLFRKCFDRKVQPLRGEMKKLADTLGVIRDLDVFIGFLREWRAEAPEAQGESLQRLVRANEERRRRHYEEVTATFDLQPMLQALREFGIPPEGRLSKNGDLSCLSRRGRRPLQRERGRSLRRLLVNVLSEKRSLEEMEPESLHALRISCKRLRYAAEFFREALSDGAWRLSGTSVRMQDEIIEQATGMQDHLGLVHDCDVYSRRVMEWYDEEAQSRNDGGGDREATGALVVHLHEVRAGALRKADDLWREMRSGKGRERLEAAAEGVAD